MANVTSNQLASLIAKSLEDYSEEVQEIIEKEIDNVTAESLQAIKDSPAIQHMGNDGYRKGFYIKNIYKGKGINKGQYRLVIANKKYRIGHLLEHGHAKLNGGRTKDYPHWINGQKIADTLPGRIEVALKSDPG